MLGLYIHIPFCVSKCHYCDFYSCRADEATKVDYVEALLKQIDEYAVQAKPESVDTVYIGGGTPTSLEFSLLAKIIKAVYAKFNIQKNVEFTVEANPGTVNLSQLKKLRRLGVNRLSIGLQSADDEELAALGRIHTYETFGLCYGNARKARFDNISVDVMYGLPSQTVPGFMRTLEAVVSLAPEHISMYGLTVGEGTYMHKHIGEYLMPDEKTEADMYFAGIDFLGSHGYAQYEISNFAKGGNVSRHNMKYWNLDEYIGLGAAAHSYFAGCRYSFVKDVNKFIRHFLHGESYLSNVDMFDLPRYSLFDEYMEIKPHERIGEYVMLRFRLTEGIYANAFAKKFGKDFDSLYLEKLTPFIKNGLIERTDFGYRFSKKGMYVSNYILSRIIDFEDAPATPT